MTNIGTISDITIHSFPCFQWKIPDFFSLGAEKSYRSPSFSSFDCTWHLELYKFEYYFDGMSQDSDESYASESDGPYLVDLNLFLEDIGTVRKPVVLYSFGMMTIDGTIEGIWTKEFRTFPFAEGKTDAGTQLFVRNLKYRSFELAPSDVLTFTCCMEILYQSRVVLQPELVELEALSADFEDLFTSKKKCDITIKVKDKEFQAHMAVLVTRSSVFASMLEKETEVVTVPDCDPDSFSIFLQYLYSGKIEDVSWKNVYHLYTIGDKYDVQVLKSFCRSYMKQDLTFQNIFEVITFAEQFDDTTLMSAAQIFFNRNVAEIISMSEWEAMMKNNFQLANKLLKEMTAKV